MRTFRNIWYLTKYLFKYGGIPVCILIAGGAVLHTAAVTLRVLGLKYVLDSLELDGDFQYTLFVIAVYAGISFISQVCFPLYEFLQDKIQSAVTRKINNILINKALTVNYECFDNPDYYDKYTRALKNGSSSLNELSGAYLALLSNAAAIIAISAVLLTMSWKYIIISVANVVISLAVLHYKNKRQYRHDTETTRIDRVTGYFMDLFWKAPVVKEIRANHANDYFIKKYADNDAVWLRRFLSHRGVMTRADMAKETASGVTFFLTLFFAARDFFNRVSSAGVFVSTLNAVEQLSMQLSSLLYTFPQFMRLSRYIENFRAVIEMPDTIEARFPGQIELAKKKNYKIEFRNVSFQYTGGDKWVLDDVSFTIESGTKAAIVGENGAGKTTLVKLLLRLYDPQKGGVYIDGVNITKIAPRSLRDAIAVVFQDVNIFSTTVRENITFDAGEAGTEDVLRSLRMVNLTEKIDAAEKGIDNPVSKLFDNGIVFSGGEEQRMAIARAFYRRQGILIMDEPSSALDPLAEYNLLQTMKQTMEGSTAMIISHRLSLCTMADKIYYLQDGRIREEGTHEQLLETNGLYADAFNKQRESYFKNG